MGLQWAQMAPGCQHLQLPTCFPVQCFTVPGSPLLVGTIPDTPHPSPTRRTNSREEEPLAIF